MQDENYIRQIVYSHALSKQQRQQQQPDVDYSQLAYIEDYADLPEGAHIILGPQGGTYFDPEEVRDFQEYREAKIQEARETWDFTDAELADAQDTYEAFEPIATDAFAELMDKSGELAVTGSYRVKSVESMTEKVYRDPEKKDKYETCGDLTDVFGARAITESPGEVKQLAAQLEEEYGDRVMEVENHVDNPKAYYRAMHMIVDIDGQGTPGEIQIKSDDMSEITEVGHMAVFKDQFGLSEESKTEVESCLTKLMDELFGEQTDGHCTDDAVALINEVRESI